MFSIEIKIIFKLYIPKTLRIMSGQKVSQNLFIQVKEKLDYYHLPSNFPIEATHLLSKLLNLINSQNIKQEENIMNIDSNQGISTAIRHEMSLIVKQNNKLHLDLMTARQQIQSLSHTIHKFQSNKNSKDKEMHNLAILKSQREEQLFDQLRQLRYKYNQLMDFLHQDPKADKEYIKRLMKHRQYQGKMRQNQGQSSINNVAEYQQTLTTSQRIKQLENKVRNRQIQIMRLQKVLQYDGLNLNKIIKNFNEELVKNRLKNADSKINYLQQSLDKTRKQNTNMKNKNGLRQALRAQVQKCHKIINDLKQQNQTLKRNANEQQFDIEKRNQQNERKVDKIHGQKHQAEQLIKKNENEIKQLNKKISFLQKQQKQAQKHLSSNKNHLNAVQQQNNSLSKKNEQLKLYYEYQLETFKRKVDQLQFQLGQLREMHKNIFNQAQILKKENSLKSQSIMNLEKIVNQLMKKNSLLNDSAHSVMRFQQSNQKNEEIQTRKQIVELQQQLLHSQNQKQQLYSDLRTLEHRFGIIVKQNEQSKLQIGRLHNETASKQALLLKNGAEVDELKFMIKKSSNQYFRELQYLKENLNRRQVLYNELKIQNDKLLQQEKKFRIRTKDLDIKVGQIEAILEINNLKLQERQERVRNLQKLLNENVQKSKRLSHQLSQLSDANHNLNRQNHRTKIKYEELLKETQDFKSHSFKNYEIAINDNLNQVNVLKSQLSMIKQAEQRAVIRYEQTTNLLNMIRRQKEVIQVDKISLERDNEHLKLRLEQMQQIQRTLVIQNQNLRNYSKKT